MNATFVSLYFYCQYAYDVNDYIWRKVKYFSPIDMRMSYLYMDLLPVLLLILIMNIYFLWKIEKRNVQNEISAPAT